MIQLCNERKESENWTRSKTGLLLLVLDSGEGRRRRKLYIILAAIGSGFLLWKDTIDHLTKYCNVSSTFHTMHLSTNHARLAGFLFDDNTAADDFLVTLTRLTSDPDDDLLNLSRKAGESASGGERESGLRRLLSLNKRWSHDVGDRGAKDSGSMSASLTLIKSDISAPCCFTHVTKMNKLSRRIESELDIVDTEGLDSCRSRPYVRYSTSEPLVKDYSHIG